MMNAALAVSVGFAVGVACSMVFMVLVFLLARMREQTQAHLAGRQVGQYEQALFTKEKELKEAKRALEKAEKVEPHEPK